MSPRHTEPVSRAVTRPIDRSPESDDAPVSRGELAIIAEAVLEDHVQLAGLVSLLRRFCDGVSRTLGPAPPRVVALIEEFESQLIPHFAAEEAEEFFGSLVTEEPRLLRRVQRLQGEHGEMTNALEALLEFANGEPPAAELAVRLARFLDSFERHEHAENTLMQQFLSLDEGGSD